MTAPPTTAIPILHFRAGELRLGIVAAAVARLGAGEPGCPHLGTVIGLGVAGEDAPRFMLTLAVDGRDTRVVVDGPVQLSRVDARDLLPTARSLGRLLTRAVIGFAGDQEHLILLLDVVWLVDHLGRSAALGKGGRS